MMFTFTPQQKTKIPVPPPQSQPIKIIPQLQTTIPTHVFFSSMLDRIQNTPSCGSCGKNSAH